MRNTALIVWLLFLAACGSGSPDAGEPSKPPQDETEDGTDSTPAKTIPEMLNQARARNNLPPVTRSTRLDSAAVTHGRDMAQNNFFSHTSSDGKTVLNRFRDSGFKACWSAENIAWGQQTKADVFESWMASSAHRKNMMSPEAVRFGLARVGDRDGSHDPLWVMIYGRGGYPEC